MPIRLFDALHGESADISRRRRWVRRLRRRRRARDKNQTRTVGWLRTVDATDVIPRNGVADGIARDGAGAADAVAVRERRGRRTGTVWTGPWTGAGYRRETVVVVAAVVVGERKGETGNDGCRRATRDILRS